MIDAHIMFQNRTKHIYVQIFQNVICIKLNVTLNCGRMFLWMIKQKLSLLSWTYPAKYENVCKNSFINDLDRKSFLCFMKEAQSETFGLIKLLVQPNVCPSLAQKINR